MINKRYSYSLKKKRKKKTITRQDKMKIVKSKNIINFVSITLTIINFK